MLLAGAIVMVGLENEHPVPGGRPLRQARVIGFPNRPWGEDVAVITYAAVAPGGRVVEVEGVAAKAKSVTTTVYGAA